MIRRAAGLATVSVLLLAPPSLGGQDNAAADSPTPAVAPRPSFGAVARLQVRYLSAGERAISEGAFLFLPLDFNLAELVEVINNGTDWSVTGEAKLARAIVPSLPWGRAVSVVTRLQVSDLYDPVLGGGLQWNITDTPGLTEVASKVHTKSLLQAFVKTRAEYAGNAAGLVDLYHWYQFPLLSGFYVRGVNTYSQVSRSPDAFAFMQDLIYPFSDKFEVFIHHVYRSERSGIEPQGTQFGVGARVALW